MKYSLLLALLAVLFFIAPSVSMAQHPGFGHPGFHEGWHGGGGFHPGWHGGYGGYGGGFGYVAPAPDYTPGIVGGVVGGVLGGLFGAPAYDYRSDPCWRWNGVQWLRIC